MNKNLIPKGFVNKLHLIYITICLVIVIIAILAITIWHGKNASTGLNNAATAASIVLAVVAIVITLVDVAGQRKNVLELKDVSEDLEKTIADANEQLLQINNMRDEMLSAIEGMKKTNSETANIIKELINNPDDTENISENTKKELNKLLDVLNMNNARSKIGNRVILKDKYRTSSVKLKELIYGYFGEDAFTLEELELSLEKHRYVYDFDKLRSDLMTLVNSEELELMYNRYYRLKKKNKLKRF